MVKGCWIVPLDLMPSGGWLVYVAVVGYQLKTSTLGKSKNIST